MLAPSLIMVMRRVAEGGKNALKIMRVFQLNMLFDNRNASCPLVSAWFARSN
jgi:hypothetical protein